MYYIITQCLVIFSAFPSKVHKLPHSIGIKCFDWTLSQSCTASFHDMQFHQCRFFGCPRYVDHLLLNLNTRYSRAKNKHQNEHSSALLWILPPVREPFSSACSCRHIELSFVR